MSGDILVDSDTSSGHAKILHGICSWFYVVYYALKYR